jgi:hypothetical protein
VTARKRSASALLRDLRHRSCVLYSSYLVSGLSPIAQVSQAKKKAKVVVNDPAEGGSGGVHIEMTQRVSLIFSLKYLINFSKRASLSDTVQQHNGHGIYWYVPPRLGKQPRSISRLQNVALKKAKYVKSVWGSTVVSRCTRLSCRQS